MFYKNEEEDWESRVTYNTINAANGHHLGGYAHFTQEDPRYQLRRRLSPLITGRF